MEGDREDFRVLLRKRRKTEIFLGGGTFVLVVLAGALGAGRQRV